MATCVIKEAGNVFSGAHYNSTGRIVGVKEKGNGCGVSSLQSVLVGGEHSLHFHLQLEDFCVITLLFVHSPTYIEKTCSIPGIVINTGMSRAPIY